MILASDLSHTLVGQSINWGVVLGVILTALLSVLLYSNASSTKSKNYAPEPMIIRHPVPIVGHIYDLLINGSSFFVKLTKANAQPIFQLRLLWHKVYVVNTEQLASSIHRQPKNLSFYPFAIKVMSKLLGISEGTQNELLSDMYTVGFMKEWHDIFKRKFLPGKSLEVFTERALDELASELHKLEEERNGLRKWLDILVMRVGTTALWGQKSPFKVDPALEEAFRTFDNKFYTLAFPVPRLTASEAFHAREKMQRGFMKFYNDPENVKGACELVQDRYKLNCDRDITDDDNARLDISLAHGLLANTVPLTLWMVHYIFTHSWLLEAVREEAVKILDGSTIRIYEIRKKCPLLVATWFEVLRVTSNFPSVRTVLEDTTVKGHVLKKGSHVVISSGTFHRDPAVWGDDVDAFNPKRFLEQNDNGHGLRNSIRPWGGGHFLCPGRFFAFTEIMSIVSTLLIMFDIKDASGKPWTLPEMSNTNPSLGISLPSSDFEVVIKRRAEHKDLQWSYDLGDESLVSKAF